MKYPLNDADNFAITTTLKTHGLSATAPRKAIFATLRHQGALSVSELTVLLPTISQASIYRCLDLFRQYSIVQDCIINGDAKVELAPRFGHHSHRMSCTSCGTIETFNSTRLEQDLQQVARLHNFQPLLHTIELAGHCRSCTSTA